MNEAVATHAPGAGARWLPPASLFVAVAVFLLFALVVPRFFSVGNITNVARVASILAIAASGQAIVLILGGIEFSFGSSVALASVVAVLVLPEGGTLGAFGAAALTVLCVSGINGVLIGAFALPPFLVTLGTLMVAHGLAASLVGGLPIDAPATDAFSWPAHGMLFGLAVPVWLALLSLVVLSLILGHTTLGRTWYFAGANPLAARLAGLPVKLSLFLGYLIAGGFCAVAAIILTSRIASGQPNLSPDLPFQTIAACAIGGIPLAGGQGRAMHVFCGVVIIAMMNNAVVLLNYPAALQQLLIAAVIIGAVLVQKLGPSILARWDRGAGA